MLPIEQLGIGMLLLKENRIDEDLKLWREKKFGLR